jgi:hypothetical protein
MWGVMTAFVIRHNMIVEEEHDDSVYDQGWDFQSELVATNIGSASFQDFLLAHHEIRDRVNHIWIHAENNPVTNLGNNPA